jgi:hypothetical protein
MNLPLEEEIEDKLHPLSNLPKNVSYDLLVVKYCKLLETYHSIKDKNETFIEINKRLTEENKRLIDENEKLRKITRLNKPLECNVDSRVDDIIDTDNEVNIDTSILSIRRLNLLRLYQKNNIIKIIKEQIKIGSSLDLITKNVNNEIIERGLDIKPFSKTNIWNIIDKYKLRNT